MEGFIVETYMSKNTMKEEFQFYLDNQTELVEKHDGKVIVIKDQKVIGVYDSDVEAIIETDKEHTLGSFLVQQCSEGSKDYSQQFLSGFSFET